ncbi:hypothetical protein [Leisingera sp. NJS204]|uniref:hypothetical protein n=1 Tax=Leisingera sp. NJS204 TaxID=2508307 RepID=UPI001010D84D|nr:hypothetical protein [Leisingera sp. NJS204]QAX31308.1 hypothetical protein ETW24_19055 [Leisingera sp. NJS204]
MSGSDFEGVDDNADTDDLVEDQETDNFDDEDGGALDYSDFEDDGGEDGADDLEGAEDGDDPDDQAPADDLIELDNGETVPLSELRTGYLKNKDYTQKTTELATEREALATQRQAYEQRGQFVETTLSNLLGFMEGLIPPEPPLHLAQQDPGAFQYQKAMRENAIAELGQITQMQAGYAEAQQGYGEEDNTALQAAEDAKLLKAMPHLSDPAKREAFNAANKKTAVEFGFTEAEAEAEGVSDHRIQSLVHYARLGKQAVHNRNNAKRRVQKPTKGKKAAGTRTTAQGAKSQSALQRLSETGSIEDAVRAMST